MRNDNFEVRKPIARAKKDGEEATYLIAEIERPHLSVRDVSGTEHHYFELAVLDDDNGFELIETLHKVQRNPDQYDGHNGGVYTVVKR